ncbi:MAG: phosphoribosyltransferase [Verrucomicrobia bacterium]|jgi:predicted phosphoribosyltransferase|nr:phosphoribosyltransferase [Verrucomicrobiota bacterium]HNW07223.1 phosphoribosyltransferase family protein [Verrucomicrobiota bacterium]HNZ76577.1 phosphoribosyltransferase family protein [Verrucomicrobiota bacterium]HOC51478.1 phosphoribosyltransferase family protein [Verrucomicrobiota bacterium]HOH40932.1 phosphoribosyltransferase family protein [Verrucomicrobiota bacterium]
MIFRSREDAGLKLANLLQTQAVQADLVLGLPRGGVIVAAQVAQALRRPLGVITVRKIGHPWNREFAVGALAEGDITLLDERAVGPNPRVRAELAAVLEEEKERLRACQAQFHPEGAPVLAGKAVLLVDDGLATGATTEAAVLSAKARKAGFIVVAAPVASSGAVNRLAQVADEVRVLHVAPDFAAVGQYYESFAQNTDEEVLAVLRAATQAHPR